jgi:hypothetical protein
MKLLIQRNITLEFVKQKSPYKVLREEIMNPRISKISWTYKFKIQSKDLRKQILKFTKLNIKGSIDKKHYECQIRPYLCDSLLKFTLKERDYHLMNFFLCISHPTRVMEIIIYGIEFGLDHLSQTID